MFLVVCWCLFLACLCHDFLHADFGYYCSKNILVSFLGHEQLPVPTAIDKSVSDVTKVLKQISMKKNIVLPEKNIETTVIASKFGNKMVKFLHLHAFGQIMGILINNRVISILKKIVIQRIRSSTLIRLIFP